MNFPRSNRKFTPIGGIHSSCKPWQSWVVNHLDLEDDERVQSPWPRSGPKDAFAAWGLYPSLPRAQIDVGQHPVRSGVRLSRRATEVAPVEAPPVARESSPTKDFSGVGRRCFGHESSGWAATEGSTLLEREPMSRAVRAAAGNSIQPNDGRYGSSRLNTR